jgi:hypothetical protein
LDQTKALVAAGLSERCPARPDKMILKPFEGIQRSSAHESLKGVLELLLASPDLSTKS